MDKGKRKTAVVRLMKAAAFLLIFAVLLGVASLILTPKENTKKAGVRAPMSKYFHGEPENTLDFAALGNSDFYRGIIPIDLWKRYGFAGIVAARPGIKMSEMYYLYKDILTCQNPRLVIVEIGAAFDLKKKGAQKQEENTLKSIAKYPSDEIGAFDDALATELNELFPAVNYHSRWKSLGLRDFDIFSAPDYSRHDPKKGYLIEVVKKPYKKGEYMRYTDEVTPIHNADRIYLDKIVRLAKENGAKVLLMEVPDTRSWDYQRHNAAQQYAQENGLPFLDLNLKIKEMGLDWKNDTKDGGEHMNLYGAQKVTAYLGSYLSRHFDLPDRRGDSAYQEWNTDVKKYEEAVKQKIRENPNGLPAKKLKLQTAGK